MTRIIQISDCHVAGDAGARYRGENARANLERLLEVVREWSPDLILATGDLSEDGSVASYRYLDATLRTATAPTHAIPGNHDDAMLLGAAFSSSATDRPLVIETGGWQLVLLNSAVPNAVPGRFDGEQLAMLDKTLAASAQPKLVALHHQPLPVGSAWIDKYPLQDAGAFWAVLGRHPAVQLVLWGHIHHPVHLERGGIQALGCPSTVCNSLPEQERFTFDPAGPACRWVELEPDGSFRTGILHAA